MYIYKHNVRQHLGLFVTGCVVQACVRKRPTRNEQALVSL